MTIYF